MCRLYTFRANTPRKIDAALRAPVSWVVLDGLSQWAVVVGAGNGIDWTNPLTALL